MENLKSTKTEEELEADHEAMPKLKNEGFELSLWR
jgi:hypothetical protein